VAFLLGCLGCGALLLLLLLLPLLLPLRHL
jgi:hypothetical protein